MKDKLAAAAREKIAAAAREKQLQLERKRRAAAFINMIRKDHPLGALDPPIIGNHRMFYTFPEMYGLLHDVLYKDTRRKRTCQNEMPLHNC